MFKRIKSFVAAQRIQFKNINDLRQSYENDLKSIKLNLGQIQSTLNNKKESIDKLREVEFQVFSQWGDDGIIQYLVNHIDIPYKTFIEFGVENYRESNTRFLLINDNWSGYVIDGSEKNIQYIKDDVITWACELQAEAAFITAENINELLEKPRFNRELGILSIDIDGNDYWIWKAITAVEPIIVIAEYNSVFGLNNAWTIPYDAAFDKYKKHPSLIYYGASLKALYLLAQEKGYEFIGCNSKGNNAYFIRKDKMPAAVKTKTLQEGYVISKFRESSVNGYRPIGKERIKLLQGLEIVDVETNKMVNIDADLVRYE